MRCAAPAPRERLSPSACPEESAIPIDYTIDDERGIVVSVGRGVVTTDELFDYLFAQLADSSIPKPLRDLHDLSGVERYEVSPGAMRGVTTGAQRSSEHIQSARLAVVAPQEGVYGLSRMFQLQSEHAPGIEALRSRGLAPEVAVFRTRDKALAWLLASDGAASSGTRRGAGEDVHE